MNAHTLTHVHTHTCIGRCFVLTQTQCHWQLMRAAPDGEFKPIRFKWNCQFIVKRIITAHMHQTFVVFSTSNGCCILCCVLFLFAFNCFFDLTFFEFERFSSEKECLELIDKRDKTESTIKKTRFLVISIVVIVVNRCFKRKWQNIFCDSSIFPYF